MSDLKLEEDNTNKETKDPTFPQVDAYPDMRHRRFEARGTRYRMPARAVSEPRGKLTTGSSMLV